MSYPEGTLWRSRADGSDRLQLTNPPMFAVLPRWSPDGTQIAFMDIQAGRPSKILLISAQGGAAKEMLAENLPQTDPGWSPDGKQMVFGRNIHQPASLQLLDLNSKQVSIIPGSQGLYSPRWSPDGRYLAALTTAQTKIVVCEFRHIPEKSCSANSIFPVRVQQVQRFRFLRLPSSLYYTRVYYIRGRSEWRTQQRTKRNC